MEAGKFFSETYSEARSRFLEAAEAAGAEIQSHENPFAVGPDGGALHLDTAWFGPRDAGTVLLNTCGTHGAEGFAGSAAQLAWMSTCGPLDLPRGVAALFVHAVNPYGFAWGLRGTENNVDLNRNFLDHNAEHPDNPLYDELHRFLCPKSLDEASIQQMLFAGARFVERHGQWALEDAISRGQYTHPDGYHYGGLAPEWSNLVMRKIIETELARASRVGFIDWHSGPAGDGELIHLCFSKPDGAEFARAAHWWGRDALDPATVNAMWGSKRPSRRGIMFWGLEAQLARHARLTGAVIEFRSACHKPNPAKAIRASLLERWLRFEGGFDAPEARTYFEEIRDDYAPRRKSWHDNVIHNALECYRVTFAGLAEWSLENARAAD
ncbi:MAG: M14 family metallopeptidase [Parvibaculum sp.]|uniref:M14 family metallopeptidase n=1 Tax=Parvibaculum sp. TaxID=2024848 RepID=UPI00283CC83A|nr:M14 family metallopeptidase [Parvibaculum sp.]MDR3499572.1 M14 family metallopeptidase [Parvibaculum sp.]